MVVQSNERTEPEFSPAKYTQMLLGQFKVDVEKKEEDNPYKKVPKKVKAKNSEQQALKQSKKSNTDTKYNNASNGVTEDSLDPTTDIEAKYYHIDAYLNQLMDLQVHFNTKIMERSSILTELEKVQQKVKFLSKPNSGNILLAEAFLKETHDKRRNLLSRIKAIDETLFSLRRQYDDTKTKIEKEKTEFIEATKEDKSEQVESSMNDEAEFEEALTAEKTIDVENLLSRDGMPKATDNSNDESTKPCWYEKYDPPLPAEVLDLCKPHQCNICGVKLSEEKGKKHYHSRKHDAMVRKYMKKYVGSCNGSKFDKHRKFITIKRNLDHSSRELSLYDKEAEVREISDAFSQSSSSPWHTESVTRFVKRSVQDFQTLLKWLEELEGKEKWDEAAICDVTYGLDTIHKNLINNLREIEDNFKYQQYHEGCIRFIDEQLGKPNQHMIRVANSTMEKLKREFDKVVEELGENVSIGQRLDQKLDHVWREYHEVRREIKQLKDRLWEVEAHEERLVELDDWREDFGYDEHAQSDDLKQLCEKIDMQNDKIMKYTRLDLDMKWKMVDSDLKKLQFLRIQALLSWLSSQERPDWVCEDMEEYLVEAGRKYCEVENTACTMTTAWVGVERNSDYDLELEMAYSKIRGALARVKYGRIENKRHKKELEIYRAWLTLYLTAF